MRYCCDEECKEVACCNHCIHLKEENYEYSCRLYDDQTNPDDICENFDCYKNYEQDTR